MNILNEYNKALSRNKCKALNFCSMLADGMGVKIYLIGGIVRDIILSRPFNDIDILVECDAILFAELLEEKYKKCVKILAKNEKFRTAKVSFDISGEYFEADIATTRSEIYEYPSALPILAETEVSLAKDVLRRDFTVNALAMSLNSSDFCDIFDETEYGLSDIKNKLIRILHNDSFSDDPSRIVRSLKYREKLGFELEEDTYLLEQECLNGGMYADNCQERIKKEVKETLNLFSSHCFDVFISENIYTLIISKINKINIPSGALICEIIGNYLQYTDKSNVWLIFLCIIFSVAPKNMIERSIEKLAFNKTEQTIVHDFLNLRENLDKLLNSELNYDIYMFLKKYSDEAIIANLCLERNPDNCRKIFLYFNKLQHIKLSVTGLDIKTFNIKNGELYGKILNKLLEEKMNNNLSDNDEKKLLKNIIELCL